MQTRKKNWIIALVALGLLLLLCFPIVLTEILAFGNPAKYNYRIEYLNPGDPVDAYLHTFQNYVILITVPIVAAFFLGFLFALLFNKKSSYIIAVFIGNLLFAGFALLRAIYCFHVGSTSTTVGIFYLLSLLGALGTLYFFPKRALDGDSKWPYYACLLWASIFFLFASATKSSYSLLNANGHVGDIVYWGGYGATRLYLLMYLLCVFVNMNFVFDPEYSRYEHQKKLYGEIPNKEENEGK